MKNLFFRGVNATMNTLKNEKVKNAILIGTLCSISYLAVYLARNILSAVTPQLVSGGVYTKETIGAFSSFYFVFYAVGQLINGAIGDKIKARYMISFGLILAGVCSFIFPLVKSAEVVKYVYGLSGFFLAMIYGPMTKVVSENTEPIYATRCSLGYTFASFFGSPLAGCAAMLVVWQSVFTISSITLLVMGIICFITFLSFEKKGIVKYNQYNVPKSEGGGIKLLIKHRIIKFTLISILTGVIRTTVVFWLPTYISERLGFTPEKAAGVFTVATLIISTTTFISIFVYERLNRNMDLTIFIMFTVSAIAFFFTYLVTVPTMNIILIVIAIMGSNAAATMLWSRYCPSLRDTGMVSGATGFLDFVSYMSASLSSTVFANLVSKSGDWGNIVLIWMSLMIIGSVISVPFKKCER